MQSPPIVRLLPYAILDGPHNMAADEVMLLAAERGTASLRFYGWSPATLSLGYFQPAAARLDDPRLAALPWVRRATGGATLVHDHELTYAVALPPGPPWQVGESWMPRMHRIVMAALDRLGAIGKVETVRDPRNFGDVLCFQQQTVGDLTTYGHKIVGSAQRRHRRCLLQHGAILLRRSEAAPALPGLFEATGVDLEPLVLRDAIVKDFAAATRWSIQAMDFDANESREIQKLVQDKYGTSSWNEKR
jgi:lipoate-protein ligase A